MGILRFAFTRAGERLLCILLLAVIVAAWACESLGWGMFGGHERQVAIALGITGVLYISALLEVRERH